MARVSNPNNQDNLKTAPKLLKYLIDNKHWSPYEMISLTLEINTSRGISPQILRHRSFSFQEFCITGDSRITTITPKGVTHKISIEKLYKYRNNKNYKDIKIRVFDEKSKTFTKAKLKEVFNTGIKPTYKITTSDGKVISSTKEHKFFTKEGWVSLEEVVGLDSKHHAMTKVGIIATNGINFYEDKDWLLAKRNELLTEKEIAKLANCSPATIHKWISKHGLTLSSEESKARAVLTMQRLHGGVWNKGKFGYKTSLVVTEEHKDKIRNARSGDKSNWWKGGVDRAWRQQVWDFCCKHRKSLLEKANFTCGICKVRGGKLEIHHTIPVFQDKTKAFDLDNLEVLCETCHDKTHNMQKHPKIWRSKEGNKGNSLTTKWVTIEKIEFMGEQQTYDLEVDHKSHNYVANGVLVHNSQRYQSVDDSGIVMYAARRQDDKNRQNSVDDLNQDVKNEWELRQLENWKTSFEHYKWALDNKIAKECARFILPLGTSTKMYMNGTLRSWIHYIQVRDFGTGTQAEHSEIAAQIKQIMIPYFPNTSEALGWTKNLKR